jgi:hypothetical protein
VAHVLGPELAQPAGELEQDPVGVHEVDAADVDAIVHLLRYPELGVIVVGDVGARHAGGDEAFAVLLDLVGRHIEGHMVHRSDGGREVGLVGPSGR